MLSLLALVVIVVAAVAYATVQIVTEFNRASHAENICHLKALFAPGLGDRSRSRSCSPGIHWQASRRFPEAYAALDAATGRTFPFTQAQVQDAHARWTASWLAWERSHDGEYALKASALQEELTRAGDVTTPLGRARVAALEREKLERYQDRYQEYIRAAKALQALIE